MEDGGAWGGGGGRPLERTTTPPPPPAPPRLEAPPPVVSAARDMVRADWVFVSELGDCSAARAAAAPLRSVAVPLVSWWRLTGGAH